MPKEELVASIRRFNRFYALLLGVFNHYALHTDYTLAQARIIGELGRQPGATAIALALQLDMDRSYTARIITAFEKHGLLEKRSARNDCRKKLLFLTDSGQRLFQEFEEKSDDKIYTQLQEVPPEKWPELQRAMQTIERIFTAVPKNN